MPILFHGTTLQRAERILRLGPDADFREPGGVVAENFSTCLPFPPSESIGLPETYAFGKAVQFPYEGGPVVLILNIPMDIIDLALDEEFTLASGYIQFDIDAGLEELLLRWPKIPKRIMRFGAP